MQADKSGKHRRLTEFDAAEVDRLVAGVGARGLPAGWTEEVDPSSGDIYFYNAATGETTWDRPAAPKPTSPAPSAANVPAVPRSYDEIHAQAIAAV